MSKSVKTIRISVIAVCMAAILPTQGSAVEPMGIYSNGPVACCPTIAPFNVASPNGFERAEYYFQLDQ